MLFRSATVMLGEAYRNEPVAVAEQLDVLREQALGSAPQMSAGDDRAVPFADVAAAYRARYVYEPPADTRDVHVTTSYGVPYPYWYGYPLWHQRPGWSLAIGWPIPRVIRPYGRMRPPVRILPDRGRSHRHRYRRR